MRDKKEKENVLELASFGGTQTFKDVLHVGKPNIGSREKFMHRMHNLLDRGWLTNNGPYVREFEAKIAALTGVKHCIAMCNGTIALEIAVRALGMSGEVIVPSFTFVATAHCLQWQEITPVFCDIEPNSHTIDPKQIEQLITPKTTGIIAVHLWGNSCDTKVLEDIAERHNLKLLFDASHALGISHKGIKVGNFGHAEVFSFHATKFVNCFEGGAIVTNDHKMAKKIRLMKNFGFAGLDNVVHLGTNGKMSEPSAAMGLTSLESMQDFIAANKSNYRRYVSGLRAIPGCRLLEYDEKEENNFQYIVIEINEEEFGLSRDQLVKILHAENIRARRYFYPGVHNMEPYHSHFPNAGLVLPTTNRVVTEVMSLPTGTAVDDGIVDLICQLIAFIAENSKPIRQKLKSKSSRSTVHS